MFLMARRDMMTSFRAFLKVLQPEYSLQSSRGEKCRRCSLWLEDSPDGQVHGSDSEKREGVNFDHDCQEENVQHHLDETCDTG